MKPKKLRHFASAWIFLGILLGGCTTTTHQRVESLPARLPSSSPEPPLCGQPIAASRLSELNVHPKHFTPESIQYSLEHLSNASANLYENIVVGFTPAERQTAAKAMRMPLPVIHRLPVDRLQSLLAAGAILSPRESRRRGVNMDEPFTPPIEDHLFGAFDCVFLSVGPPAGRERYGAVIFRFKQALLSQSWATPWSGWHFLSTIRQRDLKELEHTLAQGVSSSIWKDDQLVFSLSVFTGNHWPQIFAWRVITFLREIPDANRREKITEELLNSSNPEQFWAIIDNEHLGYLEARVSGFISLEDVEKIEVPKAKRNLILSWPEAKPWLNKISFY